MKQFDFGRILLQQSCYVYITIRYIEVIYIVLSSFRIDLQSTAIVDHLELSLDRVLPFNSFPGTSKEPLIQFSESYSINNIIIIQIWSYLNGLQDFIVHINKASLFKRSSTRNR